MGASGAVVLQYRDDAPGGLVLDVMREHGFLPQIVRLDLNEPLPDPAAFRLAVTLGRGAPAAGERPTADLEWLRRADRGGTAVLGVGSGAQALAVALGGAVAHSPAPRHAWVWISSSTPSWIAAGPWLAWRDGVIRPPARARVLAHDPVGPQVFGVGRHLGIQFHPEVTPKIVGDWVARANGGRLDGERVAAPTRGPLDAQRVARPNRVPLDAQGLLEATSREFAGASAAAHRLISTYLRSLSRVSGWVPPTERTNSHA